MNATTYGLDVAKRVFRIYWVDAQTDEIENRRFGRDELIRFLAQRAAGRVALEACGSGHWWARKNHRQWRPEQRSAAEPAHRGNLGFPGESGEFDQALRRSGVAARTGDSYDLLGIAWQYRFGGGL